MTTCLVRRLLFTALLCLLLVAAAPADSNFFLKDGDTVDFYGDSITEQRLYTTYTEAFVATRYPDLKVTFYARGVGGDTTWGGWMGTSEVRVKRDVKPDKPTVITVMLGMNDAGYVPYDPKILATYQEWYGKLIGFLQAAAPRARFTLIGTSPYDQWAHPEAERKGYNDTLLKYVDHVKWRAEQHHFGFVDFNAPVTNAIQAALAANDPKANTFVPDTIHPGPSGQLVMAAALLKGWNANGVVSDVVIDAASGSVTKAENACVFKFKDLAWSQKDHALPFPADESMELALKYSDFTDALNRQMLTVRGLQTGKYRLEIDGKAVVELPAEDWAKGVNLAVLDTPMRAQASKVLAETVKRNDALFTRWRNVEFQLADYRASKQAAAALKKVEKEIARKRHNLAQPQKHEYKLVKIQ
ncbi:MAG: SGNH/GDSL hydrolase family protein [Candidatus Hydrogenedentes bacterium]|nr:SGNH/GDSL hydrolase family protein [Candidatus Hydrogenedentota bacterium]